MFPVHNSPEKNRVGRLVKIIFGGDHYFVQKCEFYACFMLIGSWKGRKNFRVGIILSKNCQDRVTGNK